MKKLAFLIIIFLSAFAGEGELSHIFTPSGGADPGSENKALVKKFYEAFQDNNPRALNSLLASKYVVQDSTTTFDSAYSKYDAFSKNLSIRMRALHQSLPSFKLTILEMLAEGNKVLARIQIQGVQRGPFLGVEPTNKPVIIKEFCLFTIEDGKVAKLNEVWNELGIMKQIGYIVL